MKSLLLGIALLAGCGPGASSGATPPVRIFAASSLREAVSDIAARWSRESGRPVQFQFEATSTLARQIAEGAKADLFLTASPEWLAPMKVLDCFDWLSNRLVLVVPRESGDVDPRNLESLALAGEQVPAGKYARAALERLGYRLPGRVIYGANARDVLSKVSQGGARAGVVYATDAPIDPGVRVAFTFPAESHPKIVYSAGLLTGEGRALFDSLRKPWALELARRRGFLEADR